MSKSISRRKLLLTGGAAAVGAVAAHGLPSQAGYPGTGYFIAQNQGPETTRLRLGYLPIFEAAPFIIAEEKSFFNKQGMTDVEVLKQASWGALRDNVEIGSAGGGVDAAQAQMPMPHLLTEGRITKGNKRIPMYALLQTSTQGNGIAVANKHVGKGLDLRGGAKMKAYLEGLKQANTPFTAAFTFPRVNQEFWIRYWLAANGINPSDTNLIVVPPAQTVANMRTGTMDAFSTGDPWPARISDDGIGFLSALTAQIWPAHPEEYLMMRADWVDKHPRATRAVLRAIMEAQQWCDSRANRAEMAKILSQSKYIGVPEKILIEPLQGQYTMGDGRGAMNNFNIGPLYWRDARGSVSYPYKSHDTWFLTESIRWGFLPANTNVKALVDRVNREDIWKEAAKQLGGPAAAIIPSSTSRGVETFFDGVKFDPANPQAYLKSLKIKATGV